MKPFWTIGSVVVVGMIALATGCASKTTSLSTEARTQLQEKYSPWVGTARKSDFVSEFGGPSWCKPDENGSETCRFYKKLATKWLGPKDDRKSYEQFDEVIVEFAPTGLLKKVDANAQR